MGRMARGAEAVRRVRRRWLGARVDRARRKAALRGGSRLRKGSLPAPIRTHAVGPEAAVGERLLRRFRAGVHVPPSHVQRRSSKAPDWPHEVARAPSIRFAAGTGERPLPTGAHCAEPPQSL